MPSMSVNTDFKKQRTASSSNELPEKIESSFPQTPTLGHCLPCVTKKNHQSFCCVNLASEGLPVN